MIKNKKSNNQIDCCFFSCPEQDDFVFSYALKISFLQRSEFFVLGKVSLLFQQNHFEHQRY